MNILFSTILMLLTIVLIIYPFIRRSQPIGSLGEGHSSEPVNQKDLILGTLGEIEFDYQMNKLSKEDYQALKNNYSQIAVDILQAEESSSLVKDNLTHSKYNLKDIESEIERELETMNTSDQATPSTACSRCGTPLLKADQEYCHDCGERQY